MPGLTIGDTIPDLDVDTTHGHFRIHDYVNGGWAIIFSHPGDFTPVCTTELGKIASNAEEFERRGVKLLGLSCDDLQSHREWIKDIEAYTVLSFSLSLTSLLCGYPIVADPKREVLKELNMVDPDEKDSTGAHIPSRALHIIGPDKKVKLSFLYPATTGRNVDEVLRVVDALQKSAAHPVATPANWKSGEPVAISPSGYQTADLPSKKGYLRFTNV
ncbi:unnamed protein product [Spirodela intermedia]|uniref:Peroxiredoxin n=1 Tax=Spirodela intermedia TaxID=51605 RepID=A0A7I8JFH8_SPIIN|nr:unnamed protein product [Spirodela intermedia]CAA6668938.1 unnamed protein product [Spirodela intermedia]